MQYLTFSDSLIKMFRLLTDKMSTLNMLRCAPRALKKQPIWVAPSRNIALTSVNWDAPATTGSKAVLPGHEYYPGKEEYSPVIG